MKKTAEEIREFVLKCVNNSEAIMREINRDYKDGKLNGEEHDLCMSRANRVLIVTKMF